MLQTLKSFTCDLNTKGIWVLWYERLLHTTDNYIYLEKRQMSHFSNTFVTKMCQKLSVFLTGPCMSLCLPHSPPTRWMQFKLWIHSANCIVGTRSLSLSISHSETFSQIYLGFSPGPHTLFLSMPGGDLPGQSLSISRGAAPLLLWMCPKSPHFSHSDSNLTPREAIQAVATVAARVALPKQAGGSMPEWKNSAQWPEPRVASSTKPIFPGRVSHLAAQLCRQPQLHSHHPQHPLLLFSLSFTFQSRKKHGGGSTLVLCQTSVSKWQSRQFLQIFSPQTYILLIFGNTGTTLLQSPMLDPPTLNNVQCL